jgi:hypothetical protein
VAAALRHDKAVITSSQATKARESFGIVILSLLNGLNSQVVISLSRCSSGILHCQDNRSDPPASRKKKKEIRNHLTRPNFAAAFEIHPPLLTSNNNLELVLMLLFLFLMDLPSSSMSSSSLLRSRRLALQEQDLSTRIIGEVVSWVGAPESRSFSVCCLNMESCKSRLAVEKGTNPPTNQPTNKRASEREAD